MYFQRISDFVLSTIKEKEKDKPVIEYLLLLSIGAHEVGHEIQPIGILVKIRNFMGTYDSSKYTNKGNIQ